MNTPTQKKSSPSPCGLGPRSGPRLGGGVETTPTGTATSPPSRPFRPATKRPGFTIILAALLLAGCSSGPPPATYVLGSPAPETTRTERLTGRPVIEVKPVLVPDYLDVTDILVRRGANQLAPSRTGRWGERLSVGITRALAADLRNLLPGYIVTSVPPVERPSRQVLVEVETFEPRTDDSVVLAARWRVLAGSSQETEAGERVSIVEKLSAPGEAAIAAAMTQAVDALAGHIADGIRRPRRER
jgi:uncharacterized lipoprotein YmbA